MGKEKKGRKNILDRLKLKSSEITWHGLGMDNMFLQTSRNPKLNTTAAGILEVAF